jgi:hypothetical protein
LNETFSEWMKKVKTMNDFDKWLSEGDLRNDGMADEVVRIVLHDTETVQDLIACMDSTNDVVRGHAADAIEKTAREKPGLFHPYLDLLMEKALKDDIPMVQWHLAMLFGHLTIFDEDLEPIVNILEKLISSDHTFTKNWAISSLTIAAILHGDPENRITTQIAKFSDHPSAAVRSRVRKALNVLVNGAPLPKGWNKSSIIQSKLNSLSQD